MFNNFAKEVYRKLILASYTLEPVLIGDKEASDLIYYGLTGDKPFLCARLGCTELQTIIFARKAQNPLMKPFLAPFWGGVMHSIHNSSGFFNPSKESIYQFADLYESLMDEIDLFASWHPSERFFDKQLANKPRISIQQLGPDIEHDSWTMALKGKRVLVVHPFEKTIRKQYAKRDTLFDNPNVLPEFKELITVKAIQSIGGQVPANFKTWFDALEYMHHEMKNKEYDIAVIGCGAYGFPLACWAKQSGKKVVLLGGTTQLLFGIQGKRWFTEPGYNTEIMNKSSWVKADEDETPKQASNQFGYW